MGRGLCARLAPCVTAEGCIVTVLSLRKGREHSSNTTSATVETGNGAHLGVAVYPSFIMTRLVRARAPPTLFFWGGRGALADSSLP